MDGGHFLLEKVQESGAEISGIRRLRRIGGVKKTIDGGKKQFGMLLLAIYKCGVVECFCLGESLFVALDVVSVGFEVDSQAGSFVKPLKPAPHGLKPPQLWGKPGSGAGVGDQFGDEWSNRVQAEGEGAVIVFHQAVNSAVRGVDGEVGS